VAAIFALAGCGAFTAPSPTAREMADIVAGFVRRGVTVTDQVGGDAGCADPTLFGNAVRYDVRLPSDQRTVPVYVFRWKSQATFDASAAAFAACGSAFHQAHPELGELSTYEDSPWRVFGAGWSPTLRGIVQQSVHDAAGISPPAEIQ
jgi:hypothetical protein